MIPIELFFSMFAGGILTKIYPQQQIHPVFLVFMRFCEVSQPRLMGYMNLNEL